MSEEHKNCKYRFKGKSCKDCPLNCKFKRLQKENEKLKEKIAKFRWDNPYFDLYNNVVGQRDNLKKENDKLKANKGRCAFKCLDNTFCDEARIKIDKLELDKDCLNVSLETARKYRGIAEADRDKYKQALEEIKSLFDAIANRELKTFNEIDVSKIILAIKKRVNEALK